MIQNNGKPAALPDARTRLAAERTRLAHERTLMAWTRTAISLITFGFGIYQVLRALRGGADTERRGLMGPRGFGLVMIFIGLVVLLLAVLQNRREMQLLRAQYPEIPPSLALVLAALICLLGLLGVFSMIFRG